MKRSAVYAPTEKTGKVFMMMEHGMRRCLICEEWFCREGSREHNNVLRCPQPQTAVPPTLMDEVVGA
jgi:hypothetical protein